MNIAEDPRWQTVMQMERVTKIAQDYLSTMFDGYVVAAVKAAVEKDRENCKFESLYMQQVDSLFQKARAELVKMIDRTEHFEAGSFQRKKALIEALSMMNDIADQAEIST